MNFPKMPFGRWKGRPIGDIPRDDRDYAYWLLAQNWFNEKYPDEALALTLAIERWEEQRKFARQSWKAELKERLRQDREQRLVACRAQYMRSGVMPFGKYTGQSLHVVVRDERYYRWFKSSAYCEANPELAVDLAEAAAQIVKGKIVVETEITGGCRIYRPASFGVKSLV